MEYFFVDENFYHTIEDYILDMSDGGDEEWVQSLSDDWKEKIELGQEEIIFQLTEQWIVDTLLERIQIENEDRFPTEQSDKIDNQIKKAISKNMNIQKLNGLIPTMYYPSGKFEELTKQDLLDAL